MQLDREQGLCELSVGETEALGDDEVAVAHEAVGGHDGMDEAVDLGRDEGLDKRLAVEGGECRKRCCLHTRPEPAPHGDDGLVVISGDSTGKVKVGVELDDHALVLLNQLGDILEELLDDGREDNEGVLMLLLLSLSFP